MLHAYVVFHPALSSNIWKFFLSDILWKVHCTHVQAMPKCTIIPEECGVNVHSHAPFITTCQRGVKVCRLLWVSPSRTEQYFLHILLKVTPCCGYADLLSRSGNDCHTFQGVNRKLGLVEDVGENHYALRESSCIFHSQSKSSLFFCVTLQYGASCGSIVGLLLELSLRGSLGKEIPKIPNWYKSSLLFRKTRLFVTKDWV